MSVFKKLMLGLLVLTAFVSGSAYKLIDVANSAETGTDGSSDHDGSGGTCR